MRQLLDHTRYGYHVVNMYPPHRELGIGGVTARYHGGTVYIGNLASRQRYSTIGILHSVGLDRSKNIIRKRIFSSENPHGLIGG